MKITTEVLDIETYEARRFKPATMLPREGQVWVTREVPLFVEQKGEWGWCKEGDMVRIPLFPYISRSDEPIVAIGHAFELGFTARDFVDPRYDVVRLHIPLGYPVIDHKLPDGTATLRFWLGIGFVLKEK